MRPDQAARVEADDEGRKQVRAGSICAEPGSLAYSLGGGGDAERYDG
jgi:hypothetical protein